MRICLKPIGSIDNDILEELKERVKRSFGCPIEIAAELDDLDQAYDPKREQYSASTLLAKLEESGVARDEKVLGIVDALTRARFRAPPAGDA